MNYKSFAGEIKMYAAPTIEITDLAVEQGIAISTPEFDDTIFWEDEK
jgi:hypothetical protein